MENDYQKPMDKVPVKNIFNSPPKTEEPNEFFGARGKLLLDPVEARYLSRALLDHIRMLELSGIKPTEEIAVRILSYKKDNGDIEIRFQTDNEGRFQIEMTEKEHGV